VHLRIILADDHPFVLLGFRAMLATHAGVTIVGEAATATSLVELLACTPCDLLVTDLSMTEPGAAVEDGLSLVRRIRRDWSQLRVVVVTTLTNASIVRAVVSDEAVSVLGKAESMDELWRAIAASVNGVRYLGSSIVAALAHLQAGERAPLPPLRLSKPQREVVKRLVSGQSISEIAAALGCHRRTVSRRKREAMKRLCVTNNPGLFSRVHACGIIEIDSHT
jgi:two-component system capsular synthesis response regulator RcsB